MSQCAPALPAKESGWLWPWPGSQAPGPGPGPTASHRNFHRPPDLSGKALLSLGSLGPLVMNSFQNSTKSGENPTFTCEEATQSKCGGLDGSPSSSELSRSLHSRMTLSNENRDAFLRNKCGVFGKGYQNGGAWW